MFGARTGEFAQADLAFNLTALFVGLFMVTYLQMEQGEAGTSGKNCLSHDLEIEADDHKRKRQPLKSLGPETRAYYYLDNRFFDLKGRTVTLSVGDVDDIVVVVPPDITYHQLVKLQQAAGGVENLKLAEMSQETRKRLGALAKELR